MGAGLVVGSMSPDLLYFVALEPGVDERSHTWVGLVAMDLPIALGVIGAVYWLVVPAVVALAPRWVRVRVVPVRPPELDVRGVLWLVVSVLLGGVTHLVWDSFTHHEGWVVRHYPELRLWFVEGMPRYQFLQLASSVLGIAAVLWWSWRALKGRTPVAEVPALYAPPRRPGLVVAGVVAAGLVLAAVRAFTVMAGVGHQSVVGFARTVAAGVAPSHEQVTAGVTRVSICVVTGVFAALLAVGLHQRARARGGRAVD